MGFDPASLTGLPQNGGRGFGLTSMQERARLAGGTFEIRSTPGLGTEIRAVLPAIPAMPSSGALGIDPKATAQVGDVSPSEPAIGVFIVDDHEVVRRGIRQMLEKAVGIDVVGEAGDGAAAIARLSSLCPDVLIVDVQMPGLDGVATARRLRELGIETPVILLSVFTKDEQIFEGLRAGARGYLMKDVGARDLANAIRTVHGGGSLIPPVIAERSISQFVAAPEASLTTREREVLREVTNGQRNAQIAARLHLTPGAVKWHLGNSYQKLGASNRTEAVRIAQTRGLIG
jgi:DNA-binding NarL/FixJ family response regulator